MDPLRNTRFNQAKEECLIKLWYISLSHPHIIRINAFLGTRTNDSTQSRYVAVYVASCFTSHVSHVTSPCTFLHEPIDRYQRISRCCSWPGWPSDGRTRWRSRAPSGARSSSPPRTTTPAKTSTPKQVIANKFRIQTLGFSRYFGYIWPLWLHKSQWCQIPFTILCATYIN